MKVILKAVITADSGEILSESTAMQFDEVKPEAEETKPGASQAITNFQDDIVLTFKKHGRLTRNEARKFVHPERHSGGFPAFVNDFEKLVNAGVLKPCGENQRAPIYQLVVKP